MLKIDIKEYDKLYELVLKLSAITYLQYAVTDEEHITYNAEGYDFILTYTRSILYDEQRKTVLCLKKLVSDLGDDARGDPDVPEKRCPHIQK